VLERPVQNVKPAAVETRSRRIGCSFEALGFGRTSAYKAPADDGGGGSTEPLCAATPTRPSDVPGPTLPKGADPDDPLTPAAEKKILTGMCTRQDLTEYGYIRASSEQGSVCNGESGGPLFDQTTGKLVAVLSAGQVIKEMNCVRGSHSFFVPTTSVGELVARALAEPER